MKYYLYHLYNKYSVWYNADLLMNGVKKRSALNTKIIKESVLYLIIMVSGFIIPEPVYAQPPKKQSSMFHNIYRERTRIIKGDTITYKTRWFIPDQYKLQYAGNIGFMSIGFGFHRGHCYSPSIYYGYLGKKFGNSDNTVHTISVKNTFLLTRHPLWDTFTPTAGISVNWGYTNNTFDKLPEHYPEKYYFQNKIHLSPFIGGELKFGVPGENALEAWGCYAELSTLDAYLLECIRTKYVKPHMILSLAVGITFYLR